MMIKFSVLFTMLVFTLTTLLSACGGSDDNKQDNSSSAFRRHVVDWSTVPKEFNPEVKDVEFNIESYDILDIDIFSFNYDVEIIYSNELPKVSGFLRVFTVSNKYTSNWVIQPRDIGTTLRIGANGTNDCSMEVVNERLEVLEGACFVRLQVFLPKGSQLEVYNDGELISKKFLAVKTEQFLQLLADATWSEDKFVEIKNFLNSYKGKSAKPALTTSQLAVVLEEFPRSDKENFANLLEQKFSNFELQEARKIVGL